VHRWDIGAAVDVPVEIEPVDLAWVSAAVDAMGDDLRLEGVCGPPLEAPADSSPQTALLAHLGRKAW
jgi:hypothetical protein